MRAAFAKVRVARPTRSLAAMRVFYADGLGLIEHGSFRDHDGYDGDIYATSDLRCEVEVTTHASEPGGPPPSGDHLLVFYVESRAELDAIDARLRALGHAPVEPVNPYWRGRAATYEDPDGWPVVVCDLSVSG